MRTRSGHLPLSGFVVQDEVDDLFGSANPNPARSGCPPPEALRALARRERPLDDPAYEHLGFCSPCYQEFRAVQETSAASSQTRGWVKWVAAVAATLLVAVTATWFVTHNRVTPFKGPEPVGQVTRLELDLRPFAVSRAPETPAHRSPLSLSRGQVALTLQLPAGSEPGAYEVQLRDSNRSVSASTSGRAEIRDFVTTLDVTLDVRAVAAGPYQLAVRREGEDWHLYPVVVQ